MTPELVHTRNPALDGNEISPTTSWVRLYQSRHLVPLEDGRVSKCASAVTAVGIRRGVFVLEGRLAVSGEEGRIHLRYCNQGGHCLEERGFEFKAILSIFLTVSITFKFSKATK